MFTHFARLIAFLSLLMSPGTACCAGSPHGRAVAAIAVARAALEIADEAPRLPETRPQNAVAPDRHSEAGETGRMDAPGQQPIPLAIEFHQSPLFHETLPAQLVIEHWERGCVAGDRLVRDIRRQLKPFGWSMGSSGGDQIQFVNVPQTQSCPRIMLLQNGETIKTWEGYQDPAMLSHELRRAWDEAPIPAGSVAAGPAGAIHARDQISGALSQWRQRVGDGNQVLFKWDRNGADKISLFAKQEWTAQNIFGSEGRIELAVSDAINLPVKECSFGYRLVGSDVVVDLDPIRFKGFANRLNPSSQVAQAVPAGVIGIDDCLLFYNVIQMVRDVFALLRPSCDLTLPGEIVAASVLDGETLVVTFSKPPVIRLTWLFSFHLSIKKVSINDQQVVVEFSGSRFIKSRTFEVK